jgi:ribosomal protein L15E
VGRKQRVMRGRGAEGKRMREVREGGKRTGRVRRDLTGEGREQGGRGERTKKFEIFGYRLFSA